MNIGYMITAEELTTLMVITKFADEKDCLLPACEMTEEKAQKAVDNLKKKRYLKEEIKEEYKEFEIEPVLYGFMKVISNAKQVKYNNEEHGILYVHDAIVLYLQKEMRSKQTYKIIPYQSLEDFYESAEGTEFRKGEQNA